MNAPLPAPSPADISIAPACADVPTPFCDDDHRVCDEGGAAAYRFDCESGSACGRSGNVFRARDAFDLRIGRDRYRRVCRECAECDIGLALEARLGVALTAALQDAAYEQAQRMVEAAS